MTQDDNFINLQPGEVYFSHEVKIDNLNKIKTILGSCVSVTVWHSGSKVAGMCHYLLAQKSGTIKATQVMQKYRYGEEALDYLLKKMVLLHPLNEYELALFGGSNMYPSLACPSIGQVNVMFAQGWAKKNQLHFNKQDVLGNDCRSVTLNLTTGNITLIKYRDEQGALGDH